MSKKGPTDSKGISEIQSLAQTAPEASSAGGVKI